MIITRNFVQMVADAYGYDVQSFRSTPGGVSVVGKQKFRLWNRTLNVGVLAHDMTLAGCGQLLKVIIEDDNSMTAARILSKLLAEGEYAD